MSRAVMWPEAKDRRDKLRALGLCINAQLPVDEMVNPAHSRPLIEHGPPVTPGGKCQRCKDIHKKSSHKPRRRATASAAAYMPPEQAP